MLIMRPPGSKAFERERGPGNSRKSCMPSRTGRVAYLRAAAPQRAGGSDGQRLRPLQQLLVLRGPGSARTGRPRRSRCCRVPAPGPRAHSLATSDVPPRRLTIEFERLFLPVRAMTNPGWNGRRPGVIEEQVQWLLIVHDHLPAKPERICACVCTAQKPEHRTEPGCGRRHIHPESPRLDRVAVSRPFESPGMILNGRSA